jgi:electron transport complex protein RnfD
MMKQAAIIKPHADIAVRLTVGPPSHWRYGRTIRTLTLESVLALVPAVLLSFWRFGPGVIQVAGMACASAVACEALVCRIRRQPLSIENWNAFYIGLIFAMLLPAGAPWWLAIAGGAVTVLLGQALFGGLGSNPFSAPALGWAVCLVCWPQFMDVDMALASLPMNEPLTQLKYFGVGSLWQFDTMQLFLGNQVGAAGASQAAALVLGGVWLMSRAVLRPFIPLAFLVGVAVTAGIHWSIDPTQYASPWFHLSTGSVMLCAFFLAPESGPSPCGRLPMILFGLLAGAMVAVIRIYGVYPDGAPFAVLLANLLTPLLDRIRPRPFGVLRRNHA